MPQISIERIDDFRERWKASFGETITREEAFPIAIRLMELVRMLSHDPAKEVEKRAAESSSPDRGRSRF